MNKNKIISIVIALAVAVGVLVLAAKLISGAISIVSGAFNAVLGIIVIFALVVIVVWMFLYAAKKREVHTQADKKTAPADRTDQPGRSFTTSELQP